MAEKKYIAVMGATGAQGGGVVRAILKDPKSEFAPLAVTRDVTTKAAKELKSLGAEVVAADVDDRESLENAFSGAYGVFGVTFYWTHFSPYKEMAQAKNIAQAAKHANAKHVVWSTLEDTRKWVPLSDNRMPTLMENYKVPHLDSKGESDKFFVEAGVPTTNLLTSFYWENFINFGMGPKRGPDGRLSIILPMGDKKLPGIGTEDIGKCAYGIFKRGQEFVGKTVGIAGEHLTGSQMAAAFSRALGTEVIYNSISPEKYRNLGFPGAEDLGNMFQFKRDFEEYFCGARSVEFTRSLNPELQDFDSWLKENISRIPIAKDAVTA
jgi:uncharacterized protein YbjT (DUF2867 family)